MQETTHFGERTVPLTEKQGLVDAVFHQVADRYDLMNDLMSGGVHRLWKDAMVARLAPPRTGSLPFRVLDMAGGTGDIAQRILDASAGYAEVTVSDINSDMLRVGEERAKCVRLRESRSCAGRRLPPVRGRGRLPRDGLRGWLRWVCVLRWTTRVCVEPKPNKSDPPPHGSHDSRISFGI